MLTYAHTYAHTYIHTYRKLFDPYGGIADVEKGVLRAVGNAEQRLREDGLRTMRGYR